MKWSLTLFAALIAIALTGCAPALPTGEEVRDEARSEMQAVVDLLPEGAVERVEDPIPNGYVSCDGGGMYTGGWQVYVHDSADVLEYLADVRDQFDRLGYVAHEGPYPNEDASFAARTPSTGLLISVREDEDQDGTPYIDILAFSRCGQLPLGAPDR